MGQATTELRERLGEISDLGRARALLEWDERTVMPKQGAGARAEQLATLTRIRHDRLASDELGRLLDGAEREAGSATYESDEASLVRVTRRHWEKARLVPSELRAEIARTSSIAETAWVEAREQSSFAAFLPHLRRNLELALRYAECLIGFEGCEDPYDALLDDYEPRMRTPAVAAILGQLRDGLRPIVETLDGAQDGRSCLHGDFPIERQRQLVRALVAELPLPEDGWRLDDTVHPFATSIGPGDVRLTTRYDKGYLGTGVWSAIHEAGHCLYDAGLPAELYRTLLYSSVSLGFDESQSRLWENWVGLGRPYVEGRVHPRLREAFPREFESVTPTELYRAANRFRPSLIRIDSDELTYNLHIVLRFELELELVGGRLDAADLPEAWNARMRDYLGLEVPDDASGVLQDVHWAGGAFGYFPTYSLGNVIAAQLWERARRELTDLDARISAGEFEPLRDWLQRSLYRHGGRFTSPEMVERLLGELDAGPLLRYLDGKRAEVQALDLAA